jgi:choline dehydrogenase
VKQRRHSRTATARPKHPASGRARPGCPLPTSNPADRPRIDAPFLSHPDEVKAFAVGIEVCREIGNAGPLKELSMREEVPAKTQTGKDMENFVRNGATTYFHQSGSCRIGRDATAVVHAKLRVNGVRKLRIADSSIMPRIASVATTVPCVLIGERLAEILSKST